MRFVSLPLLIMLSACSKPKIENDYPTHHKDLYKFGSITGSQGFTIAGGTPKKDDSSPVNRFLWHACLNVLSILPIASADPFGGTIITEWHSLDENPNEMFKFVATIDAKELRADALSLKIYKKTKNAMGKWQNENVSKETLNHFETSILSKAGELREKSKR